MKVNTAIKNAHDFKELNDIASSGQPKVSFWGRFYVQYKGSYQGTSSLDSLAKKALELVDKNPNFNEEERVYGRALEQRISWMYDESHDGLIYPIQKFGHQFLDVLRMLSNAIKGFYDECMEYKWHCRRNLFNYYNKKQFKTAFGLTPKEANMDDKKNGIGDGWHYPALKV